MPDPPSGLTVSQAASMLGVSARTVRRWCEQGRLQAHRVVSERGSTWWIDPDSVAPVRPAGGQSIERARSLGRTEAEVLSALEARLERIETFLEGHTGSALSAEVAAVSSSLSVLADQLSLLQEVVRVREQETREREASWLAHLEALSTESDQLRQEVIRVQHEAQILAQRITERTTRCQQELLAELRTIRAVLDRPPWWKRLFGLGRTTVPRD